MFSALISTEKVKSLHVLLHHWLAESMCS